MTDAAHLHRLFDGHAVALAPALLGCELTVDVTGGDRPGSVTVVLTEVEAYGDQGEDPGAHSFRGPTPRNASLFGPPRRTYVYLNYGIHRCLNLACGPEGTAGGVLLRGAEVLDGRDLAVARRGRDTGEKLLSGPGNLGQGLGITLEMDSSPLVLTEADAGTDAGADPEADAPVRRRSAGGSEPARFVLRRPSGRPGPVSSGRRVGVSGVGGGGAYPWRWWLTGRRSVSAYRPGRDVPA
ncbi:MAG: DNA-3-methyladenine glycosylase [Nesterenkonia sp.]|nr:DNA-3-methyladenine glycosylase [Nesterenkonia sp.]